VGVVIGLVGRRKRGEGWKLEGSEWEGVGGVEGALSILTLI
jgi:hypothetical protein